MEFRARNRTMLIIVLVLIGSVLAYAVTRYFEDHADVKHHVTTGKVGTNPDGTVWVAEFIKDKVVFNYTLPASSVHSRYLYYAASSIVVVPNYSQELKLERTEDGYYAVYYPARDATIPLTNLATYEETHEKTVLLEAYKLFSNSASDIRVLSKIQNKPFAINGVFTLIHNDGSTTINGYVLTVDNKHYLVIVDLKEGNVKKVEEIDFEYK